MRVIDMIDPENVENTEANIGIAGELWRGKRLDNGKWEEGYLIRPEFRPESAYIGFLFPTDDHDTDLAQVDPATLGRRAGVPDKGQKQICEGDILKANDYPPSCSIGIVRYGKHSATIGGETFDIGFYIEWLGKDAGVLRNDLGYWAKYASVIGNIHDGMGLSRATGEDIGNAGQDALAPAT